MNTYSSKDVENDGSGFTLKGRRGLPIQLVVKEGGEKD